MDIKLIKHMEFLQDISKSRRIKDQPGLIDYLRERNYIFLQYDIIKLLKLKIKIPKEYKSYAFLVRNYKKHKDLSKCLFDDKLAFGIKLTKNTDSVLVFMGGTQVTDIKLSWPVEHSINIKKIEKMKFPKKASYDERAEWRKEWAKVKKEDNYIPLPVYHKWLPSIMELNQKVFASN